MIESFAVTEAWKELQEKGRIISREYRVCEAGINLPAGKILLAVDGEGIRHLLVPLISREGVAEDRKSSGVQIIFRELLENQTKQLFADVVCLKPHLHELFSILASEMLERLGNDSNLPPVQICKKVLERWRELLESDASPLLGTEILSGLFGELWHLREIVRLNPDCLESWEGPHGARHDISTGTTALEVKTSLIRHGRFFTIHGHEQLEQPHGGELYLAAMKLEKVQSGGESLPELILSINSLGGDYHQILTKLARIGYRIEDSEAYSSLRFIINENRIYEVNDTFPRIISNTFAGGVLPAGTLRLEYQIDLSGAFPEPVPPAEHIRIYEILAGIIN
jgi:hypothetical protein